MNVDLDSESLASAGPKLYRILTEHKNRAAVVARVARDFSAFTVIEAAGYWQGACERSLIIEIMVTDDDTRDTGALVRGIAGTIKWANGQEAVLVQSINLTAELI